MALWLSLKLRIYGFKLHTVYFLHYMWTAVQHLIWRIDGTAEKIERIQNGQETDEPAQVLKVIWKNPLDFRMTPRTYFTKHERFASASIINNKRVHFLSLNSRTATFTEVDRDILDSRKYPFLFFSQTEFVTRFIVLPTKIFYKLVDEINIEDKKVIWLLHTMRCGSTVWVQAFNAVPDITIFSEPLALHYSITYGDHGYSSAASYATSLDCRKHVVGVIKMHLRHAPKNGYVLWKAAIDEEVLLDIITECFPQHKFFAMFRDPLPSITSFHKTFSQYNSLRYTANVQLNHDPYDDQWWFHIPNTYGWTNGVDHNFCKKVITDVRPKSISEWFCFMYAAKASGIKRAIEKGVVTTVINYDSLVENKYQTISQVFEMLGLGEYTDQAMQLAADDSQAGVAKVSRSDRKKGDGLDWCQDVGVVKRCNMILKAFDLPNINSSLRM